MLFHCFMCSVNRTVDHNILVIFVTVSIHITAWLVPEPETDTAPACHKSPAMCSDIDIIHGALQN